MTTLHSPIVPNGLALEYQGNYGSARGYLNISDVVGQPLFKGVVRVFGPGFSEEFQSIPSVQVRTLVEDAADTFLE